MADGVQNWDDFKALVDDPHLPDETKKNLILSLANSTDYYTYGPTLDGYDADGFKALKDKYGITDDQVSQYAMSDMPSFADVSSKAQENAKGAAEHDKAVTDGKNKLADMGKAADRGEFGGAGAKNSNEILDQGAPALKYLSDFLPLYAKAGSQFKDSNDPVQQMKQVYERYDEQRDIPFDKFLDEATKLDKAADASRDASGDMGSDLTALFEHWTGDAATGAQQLYSTQDKITQDVVVKSVRDAGALVKQTQASVAQIVRNKATSTLDIFHASDPNFSNGFLAGKSTDQWSTTIDVANGGEDMGTLRRAAEAWGVHIDENCSGSLTGSSKAAIRKKAMEVVHNILVKNITQDWTDFMKMCDETKKSVDTTWQTLADFGGKLQQEPYQPKPESPGQNGPAQNVPGIDGPQGFTSPSGGQDVPGTQPPASPATNPSGGPTRDSLLNTGNPPAPGSTPPPAPQMPDLSGIGANGGPADSGGPGPGGAPKTPDLSGLDVKAPEMPTGGPTTPSGMTPDLSGIDSGGGPSSSGGAPPPTPKMPDLSARGAATPTATTTPSSATPDLSSLGGPSGGPGPGSSMPTPQLPDLSGVGANTPNPLGGDDPAADKSTVDKLRLPGGASATIGKPDAHGNQLLTIKDPDGGEHEFELAYDGRPGPHQPGVTTVLPDADGHLKIHDGKTTLTIDQPGPDGAVPITVDGAGKSADFRLVPPGTKLDAPDLSGVGGTSDAAAFGGGHGGGGSASFAGGSGGSPAMPAQPSGFSDAAVARAGDHGAPGAATAGAVPGDQTTKPGGGSPGMGGMGGMHGGGGQGGDKERQSKWGMAGNLFDDTSTERGDRLQAFLEGRPREKKG